MTSQEKKRPFGPDDVYRVAVLTDPVVRPDGNDVACVVRTVQGNQYRAKIWLMESEGGANRSLDLGGGNAFQPAWSPDSQYLMFLNKSATDKVRQIYVLPVPGGEARRLTAMGRDVISARWSIDGRYVAFLSFVDPYGREEQESFAADVDVLDRVVWREDGKGNLLHSRQHLFLIPADGGDPVQLTEGHFSVGQYAFSIDGEWIFYLAPPDPDSDRSSALHADIFMVRLDGSERHQITDFPGAFTDLIQSPAGELYAIGNDRKHLEASPSRLWRIDLETGEYEAILPNFDRSLQDSLFCDVRFPSQTGEPWLSPDGNRIRFRVTDGPSVRLAEVNIEGAELTWLSPSDISVLAWHCSRDGRVRAEIRTSMTSLPELWVAFQEDGARQLTTFNAVLQDERLAFEPQHIPFTASDGTEVDGWMIMPSDVRDETRPLVLAVHGGPKRGIYGHAFLLEFHMLAAQGFAIAYCNYRGSDGYGTEFARAAYGREDGRDVQDILEFLDHVLSLRPSLDPNYIGINGGGFGGFLSNWIITQNERFAAAISQRSITNWNSLYGASPIGFHMAQQHLGCRPWEDPEHYYANSPVSHAQDVRTPLLLIHGDRDLRCTIEQADQFFAVLKRLGREVRLARFPEEGHGMTRTGQPVHRAENLRLILGWFEKWLHP